MKTDPAFPCDFDGEWRGMNLRDYFAAKALGMIEITYQFNWTPSRLAEGHPNFEADEVAKYVYQVADAMLKARVIEITDKQD